MLPVFGHRVCAFARTSLAIVPKLHRRNSGLEPSSHRPNCIACLSRKGCYAAVRDLARNLPLLTKSDPNSYSRAPLDDKPTDLNLRILLKEASEPSKNPDPTPAGEHNGGCIRFVFVIASRARGGVLLPQLLLSMTTLWMSNQAREPRNLGSFPDS